MKYIIGARRSGKTTQLLEWVLEGHPRNTFPYWSRVIISFSHQEARRLRNILKQARPELDTQEWVFSVEEWQSERRGINPTGLMVAVDEASYILEQFIGHVVLATLNNEEGLEVLPDPEYPRAG
jgi:hypothetical protein